MSGAAGINNMFYKSSSLPTQQSKALTQEFVVVNTSCDTNIQEIMKKPCKPCTVILFLLEIVNIANQTCLNRKAVSRIPLVLRRRVD